MNRRDFFGVVGAAIAGAVIGDTSQLPADSRFLAIQAGNSEISSIANGLNLSSASSDTLMVSHDDLSFQWQITDSNGSALGELVRINGDGTVRRFVCEPPTDIDFDYYDAWL